MTKFQLAALLLAVALFVGMYIGCETKSNTQKALEKTRAVAAERTDINVLLKAARQRLDAEEAGAIAAAEQRLSALKGDTAALVAGLMRLAGLWYNAGYAAISGHYAQQIAELVQTEEVWSTAGATYAICLQRETDDKVRAFCTKRAVEAFEQAISLNPGNVSHRINLALVYAENPPQEDVMRGVKMLQDLNRQYPDNVSVLNSLARLALKTGQYERAIQRLERVLELDAQNTTAICLLADAWQGAGDEAKARQFAATCNQAKNDNSPSR